MLIQLFDEIDQDKPTHEFTITSELNHVQPNSIVLYEPTGVHYVFYNMSKGVRRYRKAEVVSINVKVGGL